MEDDLPIRPGVVIPGHELRFTASRSSGPGGQHVNKTSSRVTLHWNLRDSVALTAPQRALARQRLARRLSAEGELSVSASSERSQHRNRRAARDRLAELIRRALQRRRRRIATRTPAAAKRKRLENKRRRGDVKRLRRSPRGDD